MTTEFANHAERLLAVPDIKGNIGNWQERHTAAVSFPRGPETPIVGLVRAWLQYADAHHRRYEDGIGEDGILGECWSKIGNELRGLLNGELGRLDGGTLDTVIYGAMKAEGFDPDTM